MTKTMKLVPQAQRAVRHVYFVYTERPSPESFKRFYLPPRGPFKIGVATNLQDELKALQRGNPSRLLFYDTVQTTSADTLKVSLHEHFADRKVRADWYDITTDEIDGIK